MIDKLKQMGLNLIPLKPNSKQPIGGSWKEYQEKKYEGSFPKSCNLGVICGKTSGNLFVLDLDDKSLIKDFNFDTLTVETGRGYHLYFYYEGLPPPNKKMHNDKNKFIDIKSQGGYVLAPSSIHPDTLKPYIITNDVPIMKIKIPELKQKLQSMNFNVDQTDTMESISRGVISGSRNASTFKYACYLIRQGLFGEALKLEVNKLNQKHTPPLSDYEINTIIKNATNSESNAMNNQITDANEKLLELEVNHVSMQEITPILENKLIEFDCLITGSGERKTFTRQADYKCDNCGEVTHKECDDLYRIKIPKCQKCKIPMMIIQSTKVTEYIQQLRIEEFLESAKNSTPVEFDAEITDENVGQAFIGDRKTIEAKFRSIENKNEPYNSIVFQIIGMKDMDQKQGCLPTNEELKEWKSETNFFEKITSSIAPDLYINPQIIQCLILWGCGGNALNQKRDRIHLALLGDAQLGKSELLNKMHKLLVGSGYTVGRNTTGAGLTIGTVKLYNGTSIPKAGFFPRHTGRHCIIDEIDKMSIDNHNSCLDVMEDGSTTYTKNGVPSLTLPTECPLLVGGNPKGGKFNVKLPSIMDNFNMETPFISRFDVIWLLLDENDPQTDQTIRDFIKSFGNRQEQYYTTEQLQRYFTFINTLTATMPDYLRGKIDKLHSKMRLLNKSNSGMPIGIRQYHGLYRLLTASAKAHLRTIVTDEDFELVENIIRSSYRSIRMNLDSGQSDETFTKRKDSKQTVILEVWASLMNTDLGNSVDKEEFIIHLGNHKLFNPLTASSEFERLIRGGIIELDNDTERYIKVK